MMANRIFTVIDDQPVYLPGELSRKILLMLDGGSLHQARQVCQGWNEAVLNLVWGQDRAHYAFPELVSHHAVIQLTPS